jgi:predicted aldo/keto reductase-like oxidoreductase
MEPLFGGALATPPRPVLEIWNRAPRKRSAADWALQWIWSQPEVSLVLSGMNSLEQVEENIESASASRIGLLTDEEQSLVDEVREKYQSLQAIPCSQCLYCLPCPGGVDIPRNLELYNDAVYFKGNVQALNTNLYRSIPAGENASNCEECGECEEKCPQDIPIREWLPRIHKKFTGE